MQEKRFQSFAVYRLETFSQLGRRNKDFLLIKKSYTSGTIRMEAIIIISQKNNWIIFHSHLTYNINGPERVLIIKPYYLLSTPLIYEFMLYTEQFKNYLLKCNLVQLIKKQSENDFPCWVDEYNFFFVRKFLLHYFSSVV